MLPKMTTTKIKGLFFIMTSGKTNVVVEGDSSLIKQFVNNTHNLSDL